MSECPKCHEACLRRTPECWAFFLFYCIALFYLTPPTHVSGLISSQSVQREASVKAPAVMPAHSAKWLLAPSSACAACLLMWMGTRQT
jgi:hypothetical protein